MAAQFAAGGNGGLRPVFQAAQFAAGGNGGLRPVFQVKADRQARINHELQRELANLIATEMKDPRMGFVTVTRVEITPDFMTAKVFVSIIGDRHVARQSMEALDSAKRFLRGELGHAVKLRHTPDLVFVEDRTTERAIALSQVLAKTAAQSPAALTNVPHEAANGEDHDDAE